MDLATGRRELHRFRPGDSCETCNARRWYSDSSFRYCENGHLIEVGELQLQRPRTFSPY